MRAPNKLRPLLLLATVVAFAMAFNVTAYAAPLAVEHQSAAFSDVDGDGIYRPGDNLRLTETVHSLDTVPLLELRGVMSVGTPGVSLSSGAVRTFPVAAAGASVSNTSPFQISLLPQYECGRTLDLGMTVMDGEPAPRAFGQQVTLPSFRVPTGAEGATRSFASNDVPKTIADSSTTESSLQVALDGRIKQIRVKVGSITHTATGELRLTLIAPDGTEVLLVNHRGGGGDNFTNTVFAIGGTAFSGLSTAPFTGTFSAEGSLAGLVDREQDGTWKLRAEDSTGGNVGTINNWGVEIVSATCAFSPSAVIDIAPSPAAAGQTVTFDASASADPTGDITKYEWDLDGNGSYEVDSGTTPTTSRSYSTLGSYNIGLRITSSGGSSATAHQLLPVTTPPTARFVATPSSPLSGETATLNGSSSSDPDPGGSVVRWEWDLDNDGSFETDEAASSVETSWATAGDHVARLRVTDNHGATATVAHTVTVLNRPPTAALVAPAPAMTGVDNEFTADQSTDLDGEIVKYEWDLDGNGSYEQDTGAEPSATHNYSSTGPVIARLRVTDNLGDTDVDTASVAVARPPSADIQVTPNPARPGSTVSFDASGSTDSDGTVESYRWDFEGDGTYDTASSASPLTTHVYLTNATFPATVEVTDNDGATNTASVDVAVVNQLPLANIVATPESVLPGDIVGFDASGSSDPDGTITKYEWDLDGAGGFEVNGGSSPLTSRSYPNPGLVIVRLRVTDDTFGTKIATLPVTIDEAPGGGGGTPGVGGPIGGGTPLGGNTPAAAFAAVLGGQATQRLKAIAKGGVQLTCRATQNGTCAVALEVSAKDAAKLKLAKKKNKKPVIVGRATVTTSNGADAPVLIKLNAKVKKALKKGKRVKVMARASATAGANTASAARTVTLRK